MYGVFTNFLPYISFACPQLTADPTILQASKNVLPEEGDIPNIRLLVNAAISVVAPIWEWPGGDPATNLPIKYRTAGTNAVAGVIPYQCNFMPVPFAGSLSIPGRFVEFFTRNDR
jgi:hypothetical protein